MSRRSLYTGTLEAAVREHFGLSQDELARYLGVTKNQVGNLEAGRRQPTPALSKRLLRLADLLPPPEGQGPPAPDFAPPPLPAPAALFAALPNFGPLPPAPLRKRQRQAAAQAAALRLKLHQAGKRGSRQARRQWGLAVLQAALPAQTGTAAEQGHITRWLHTLAADVTAATPGPAVAAARALAVLRLLALEAEVAALAQLLDASAER